MSKPTKSQLAYLKQLEHGPVMFRRTRGPSLVCYALRQAGWAEHVPTDWLYHQITDAGRAILTEHAK